METSKVPVSVMIPVRNEKRNIVPCLKALGWADEIFVVDSQSTDGTIELAEGLGAKVVQFHFNGDYPKKRNWALENLPFRNEWVLMLDADEVVPPALQEEIRAVVAHPSADGYRLHFKYMFLGRPINHCGYASLHALRLFPHKLGRYERMPTGAGTEKSIGDMEIHEHLILNGTMGDLKTSVLHYAYPTIDNWVEKHNRYSNWEAALYDDFIKGTFREGEKHISRAKRIKRRVKSLYLRLPCRPLIRFCYHYFARAGFLDGHRGFIFCVLLSFYDFLSKAKVWELKHPPEAKWE